MAATRPAAASGIERGFVGSPPVTVKDAPRLAPRCASEASARDGARGWRQSERAALARRTRCAKPLVVIEGIGSESRRGERLRACISSHKRHQILSFKLVKDNGNVNRLIIDSAFQKGKVSIGQYRQ